MQQRPTLTYALDSRRDEQGRRVVKLRLTHNRVPTLLPLPRQIALADEHWQALQAYHIYKDTDLRKSKAIDRFKDLRAHHAYLYGPDSPLRFAETLVEIPFDKELFKQRFYEGPVQTREDVRDLFVLFEKTISRLRKQNRIGSALAYRDAMKSLHRFLETRGLHQLIPRSVTTDFLAGYENWMTGEGRSLTTVGIYVRQLRAVYNEAAELGWVGKEDYPFGKRKYTVPQGANPKKSLPTGDIEKILSYRVEWDGFERRSHDLWVFSYLCNGMNFADVCRLRWRHIDKAENKIVFDRTKTSRSRRGKRQPVVCYLFSEAWEIINRYAVGRSPDSYVFPFVDDSMDAERQKAAVRQVIKVTNNWMKKVAAKLGIPTEITTQYARHSFATMLMRSDTPVSFISQALGHSSMKTTENYLGSFEDGQSREYLKSLLIRGEGRKH